MKTHLRTQLQSGLTAVIVPNHSAPVAAFQVWLHAGGFDELPDERGLAHLHEHMLFKGTPTHGVGEIASAIEACGGQINAWTSHDQTVYHVTLPAHAWREGLAVLADATCHPLFDPEELAREIEVVVEEIKRADDTPSRVAYRRLFEMVYGEHPYALPVLGTVQSVRGMTQARMRAFYNKHYVAPNATVVAVGDFDSDEVLAEIETLFADLGRPSPPARKPHGLPTPAAAADSIETAFSESRLVCAFPAPDLQHEDVAALDVLALVLGQGDSSRLFRTVRRDLGLANEVGTSCYTPERAGLFSLSILTSRDRLAAAWRASLEVLAQVLDGGIEAEELDKARNIILSDAIYKLETMQGMAGSAGYFSVVCDDPDWERTYHDAVQRLGVDDVLRVARTWLRVDRLQVVQMLAGDDTDAAEAPTAQELLAVAQELLPAPPMALALRVADVVEGIEKIDLPGGDVLLAMPEHTVPVMGLRVAALGGLLSEGAANNGHMRLFADLLTRGTASRSGDEIAAMVDNLAGDLSGFSGKNSLGLSAIGLSRHSDTLLGLLLECLHDHVLPSQELDVQREAQLEDIRHKDDAPARSCFHATLGALYGDHPYGLDTLGTLESVAAANQADLHDMGRRRLAPGALVWAAAGDIDPDRLARRLSERVPADRRADPLAVRPAVPQLESAVQLRPKADKAQAHVAIAFRGVTLTDPDRYALSVLSTVLSGQGGRLFVELRDKLSLAYSVSSMQVEGVDPGYFAFYIGTSPDKVDTALSGLYAEIDKVVQAPLREDELARARAYLAGGHAIGLQRSTARASVICFNHLYGLQRESWRTHLEQLLAVQADDVLRAARRILTVGRHVETVLAP